MNEKDRMQVQQAPQMLSYYSGAVIESINSITKDVFDGDEFVFGNVKIKDISTHGHTQCGMCYLIDGKLFSGDTLFRECVGRCDLPGGNWKELLSSVRDKLFKLPDETIVYTGHGPSTTIGYEKKYNEILNI